MITKKVKNSRNNDSLANTDIKDLATNAVFRTMTILETLSFHQGQTLEEFAPFVGLSRPTLFRFLIVLQRLGYVNKDKNNRYSLTPKIFELGARSIDDVELSRIARPLIEDLSFNTGETVILNILDGNFAVHVQKIESRYSARFYERIGKRIPLYCTAPGKVLLASLNPVQFDAYIAKTRLIAYTENTVTDPHLLQKQIREIKEKNYCEVINEYERDVHTLACPIYDHEKTIIAAVSINWPTFRNNNEKRNECLLRLEKVAKTISALMGCSFETH